jgi:hypothetical protein
MRNSAPADGKLTIHRLGTGTANQPDLLKKPIASLALPGSKENISRTRDFDGLHVILPAIPPCENAFGLKLKITSLALR